MSAAMTTTAAAIIRAVKPGVMINGRYRASVRIWGRGAGDIYHVTPPNYRSGRRTWLLTDGDFAGHPSPSISAHKGSAPA